MTIIVPTYNCQNHIDGFLKSFKVIDTNEYSEKIELLFIDGGSTDKTLVKLNNAKFRFKHHIYSSLDKGIYDAMNKGIILSKGEFIYFIGADDRLSNEFVNIIPFLNDPDTIYYSNVKFSNGRIYNGKYNLYKLLKSNIPHQGIFYPKKIIKTHLFDIKYKLLADYNLNLILWSKNYPFAFIDLIIAEYSLSGISSTQKDLIFKSENFKKIYFLFGTKGLIYKIITYFEKIIRSLFPSIPSDRVK